MDTMGGCAVKIGLDRPGRWIFWKDGRKLPLDFSGRSLPLSPSLLSRSSSLFLPLSFFLQLLSSPCLSLYLTVSPQSIYYSSLLSLSFVSSTRVSPRAGRPPNPSSPPTGSVPDCLPFVYSIDNSISSLLSFTLDKAAALFFHSSNFIFPIGRLHTSARRSRSSRLYWPSLPLPHLHAFSISSIIPPSTRPVCLSTPTVCLAVVRRFNVTLLQDKTGIASERGTLAAVVRNCTPPLVRNPTDSPP